MVQLCRDAKSRRYIFAILLAGANFWATHAKIYTSASSTSAISTCGISTGTMNTSSISTIFSASPVSTSQHYCTSVILGSITQTNLMLFFRFLWLTGNILCFVAKSDLSKFTFFLCYFSWPKMYLLFLLLFASLRRTARTDVL